MSTSNDGTKDKGKDKDEDLHLETRARSPSTDSRFLGKLCYSPDAD